MRIQVTTLLLLMSIASFAVGFQKMDEQGLQDMMQQMKKMESCMQDIDGKKLRKLERRTVKFESELNALCANGNRKKAQLKAISFEKTMLRNSTMQKMKKCSEIAQVMMPNLSFIDQDKDLSKNHVCD